MTEKSVAYKNTTTRLPDFPKTKMGEPGGFSLFDGVLSDQRGRKAFLFNSPLALSGDYEPSEPLKAVRRRGDEDGDKGIHRPRSKIADPKPRSPDFTQVQALDMSSAGRTLELGEATLGRLFDVEVPDPLDANWLAEKARLTLVYRARGMSTAEIVQELKINKPLGRDQRTTLERRNMAEASLTASQKLAEIEQEIKEGRAESRTQQATLSGEIAIILNSVRDLTALTVPELRNMTVALARLDIPKTRKELGLSANFIDSDHYFKNAGLINLYLFNSLRFDPDFKDDLDPSGLNFLNPIHSIAHEKLPTRKNPSPAPVVSRPVAFHSMVSSIQLKGAQRKYLDLDARLMINQHQMRTKIATLPGGFTNPEVSILVANQ